jgi:hypothetical protein
MTMSNQINQDALAQHWVHSHEEDTNTEMVFRPATYNFPRSRGRRSFELKTDGILVEGGMAPDDRRQETQGRWELQDSDTLVFYTQSASQPSRVMPIVSVDKDRLVIKK